MDRPEILSTLHDLHGQMDAWRNAHARIALVPTMGALHEGHLSLVDAARKTADRVVVSIFVNPAQFGPHEDFNRYPRDLDADRAQLAAHGATDLVFAPPVPEFYPAGFATRVETTGPALGLESDFRPHFFAGVATIVAKLLIAVLPQAAFFGEKDYQQLLVIRQLVRDLGLRVDIVGAPIVREPDGLALSSRNAYLNPREREIAGQLNRVLADVAARVREGTAIAAAEKRGEEALRAAGFESVDYVAVRDANTLAKISSPLAETRVLAAATIGKTRLIDNMAVNR